MVAATGSINVDSTESDIALMRISTCMIHLPLEGQVVTRLKGIRSEKSILVLQMGMDNNGKKASNQ